MPKPYHIIATEVRNGYNIMIPENPDISARCVDAADIIPTTISTKEFILIT